MQITSEIMTTSVNVSIPEVCQDYYLDKYTLFVDEYTKYLRSTATRYTDTFYYWNNDNIIGLLLELYGEYTDSEVRVLNQLMQQGFVVYDIGANIGFHSVGLAKNSRKVYSFEPNNKNLYLLRLNTKYFDNIEVFDYAISNSVGTCHIQDYRLDGTGNYGDLKISDVGQVCNMTTIDKLVNERKILPPNIVKIDVEGYEYKVIEGMTQTIKDNLPIIMYEHMHGEDLPKVYDLLTELGYEIYWFPAPYYLPDNFKNSKDETWKYNQVMNALALPFYLQAKTNLPKKMHRDETWNDVVDRLRNAQQNS